MVFGSTAVRLASNLSASAVPSTQADTAAIPSTASSGSEKSQKISKAMKAYLEHASAFS